MFWILDDRRWAKYKSFVIPDRICTVYEMCLLIPAPFNDAFSRRPASPNKMVILRWTMSLNRMCNVGPIMWEMKKYYLRVKEQRNILHEIRKRKANWIGHISRRNCLLQRVIEGKIKGGIEVTGRRGRRRRKPLDDLKKRRGYCHLKEEALDRTMWRPRFGRGFGPVVRQTNKWRKEPIKKYEMGRGTWHYTG